MTDLVIPYRRSFNLFAGCAGNRIGAIHFKKHYHQRHSPNEETPGWPRSRHIVCNQVRCGNFRIAAVLPSRSPYGADPYILQLQSATVVLETNKIRHTSAKGYASNKSLIRVPDYALSGSPDLCEPEGAKQDRRRSLDFVWIISRPDPMGAHDLDAHHILGAHDRTNRYFSLSLFPRMHDGGPIQRAISSSPNGYEFEKKTPVELIRNVIGPYVALC